MTMNVVALIEGNPAVFRNKTDLKKFVRSHDSASIGDLVEAINLKLNLSIFADNEGHHHRLEAGRMLLELRARVEAEGGDWWKWRNGKFDRSRKDMEKLMRMASADDPEGAAEKEKSDRRESMKRIRVRGAHMGSNRRQPTSDVDHILYAVRTLTDDQRAELFTKLKEMFPWP